MGLFGSLIGAATSIFGGNSQKKAADKAAKAQVESARLAIEEQRRQFDQTQRNFAPYLGIGTGALDDIADLTGIRGGVVQGRAIDQLQASPEFAAIVRNGDEAILANASATGGLRGGNVQDVLSRFRGDTLVDLIQRQLGNLGGIANMGMGSAGQLGQFGANMATQVGNNLNQQGAARAGAAIARGGITANQWQAAGDGLESVLSSIFGGGGIKL